MAALGEREFRLELLRLRGLDLYWKGSDEEILRALRDAIEVARANAWDLQDLERLAIDAPGPEVDERTCSLRPYGVSGFFEAPDHAVSLPGGDPFRWTQTAPLHEPVRQMRLEPGALVVVGGPPGVGKTYLVDRLDLGGAEVLCPDALREEMVGAGQQEIDGAELMGEVMDQLDLLLADGKASILSAPAVKPRMIRAYARAAIARGRAVHMIYLDGDRQLCDEGQAQRDRKLPDEVLEGYVFDWQYLKERILGMEDPENDRGRDMMRDGYRSVSVMSRTAADALKSLRFD